MCVRLYRWYFKESAVRLGVECGGERGGRRPWAKTVQVVDLQGFGWGHTDKRMYGGLMSACNDVFAWNNPESMHKIIIINAPMAFQARA